MDDEIIRFIVATDNHLGYCERDPIRGNDSYAAFEEILKNAQKKNVDFVLLAGDLFHENKPSRKALHNSLELFRRYCLGNNSVYIEILNEQNELFKSSLGKVNYEDPYHAVSLPVFAIHGNHDDPSREGGNGEALAALDLLAVSNLVNYFGKTDTVDNIEIAPILMKKDKTKIALYGLGAIRDERLNRMWNQKKVKFIRLTVEQGRDDFFNIFMIHQNRDYGRGKKNCIHESMIPDWMDLVIWGNEHECIPQLQESLVGTYRILQPGSSVACSLSKTESASCPKHIAYFEVKERKFRMKPIKLTQIRQLIYDEISLKDYPQLDPSSNKIEDLVKEVLRNKVTSMITEGRNNIIADEAAAGEPINGNSKSSGNSSSNSNSNSNSGGEICKFRLIDPKKVLIRLKVDYEGFSTINHQRFGAQFVGEVANPAEILLLTRRRPETVKKADPSAHGELRQLLAEGAQEEINRIRIEDLVNETLASSKYSLSILTENEMAQALDDYIIKKIPNAIQDLVIDSLEKVQLMLSRDATVTDKNSIMKAAEICKSIPEVKEKKKKAATLDFGLLNDDLDDVKPPVPEPKAAKATTARGRGKKATASTKKMEFDDDDEEEDRPPSPVKPKPRAKRATATKKSFIELDSESEKNVSDDDEEEYAPKKEAAVESDDDFIGEEEAPKPKRGRKATKVISLESDEESVKPKAKKAATASGRGKKRVPKDDPPKVAREDSEMMMDIEESPPVQETPVLTNSLIGKDKPAGKKTRQLPLSFSQASNASTASKSRFGKTKDIVNEWDD